MIPHHTLIINHFTPRHTRRHSTSPNHKKIYIYVLLPEGLGLNFCRFYSYYCVCVLFYLLSLRCSTVVWILSSNRSLLGSHFCPFIQNLCQDEIILWRRKHNRCNRRGRSYGVDIRKSASLPRPREETTQGLEGSGQVQWTKQGQLCIL